MESVWTSAHTEVERRCSLQMRLQYNAMQNTLKYNTTQNICKAKQNTTLYNGWVSTAAVLFLFHPSTSPDFNFLLIFTRGRRWSKVAKRKKLECEIAWDLRFTQTADWARRYEPIASECKSQCKGGTRVHVDKIRCFIHLGTLLADFTTILAGDNRFPKVTRGFQ